MSSHVVVHEEALTEPAGCEHGPELPKGYGATRLILMARDPRWLHAYWEVAPDTWTEAERLYGLGIREIGKTTLRFRAVGNGVLFDVGVRLEARNWYVRMPTQAGHWKAELGLMLPDGRFALLAVSNEVRLPTGRVSDALDDKWAFRKAKWERVHELSAGSGVGAGSFGMAKAMSRRWKLWGAASSRHVNDRVLNREANVGNMENENI